MSLTLYELVGRDAARPFSPHCWKVRMALCHKRLDFATAPVPFTGIPAIENGATRIVPLLRDGDRLVADSFVIAEYLEAAYPDAPSLFGGEGGRRLSRFVESWSQRTIHPMIVQLAVLDIHDGLAEPDQAYFRADREAKLGRSLEAVAEGRDARIAPFRAALEPMRAIVDHQPFLGGETPLFADYILFGALQWLRVTCPLEVLEDGDPVGRWFERCLMMHGGEGVSVAAAAAA